MNDNRLWEHLYDELRELAAKRLKRERTQHTLGATALVHEPYLRMAHRQMVTSDEKDVLHLAAATMRRVLVDHARNRHCQKRKTDIQDVSLDRLANEAVIHGGFQGVDILILDEALDRLAAKRQVLKDVVELRLFLGLSIPEIGQVLSLNPRTTEAYWAVGRAFLFRELSEWSPKVSGLAPAAKPA